MEPGVQRSGTPGTTDQRTTARGGVCREKVVRQLKESLGDIFKRDLLTVIAKRGETAEPVVWAMMSDHGTSLN